MKKYLTIVFSCIFCISFSNNIIVDNQKSTNLKLDKAANGVPLVNIEAPNSKGLSHNIFKEYNVGKEGIILNNALYFETTKLGGMVYGNPNLQANQKQASTILTEVSGINKTKLEGFTEIAGKQADYILANPNGIYVNGAGFINVRNVTLSTGNANNILNPKKGNIEIIGKGIDLKNIDKSDLIARTAKLSAPIYGGNEVNFKLGAENKEEKPEFALDARTLGSIYAGKINIISTEDGVGVKSDSLIYAEKGNLLIDSKGKVQLKNAQAKENINVKSKEAEIKEKLISEKSINISGDTKNFGEICSNEDFKITGNLENYKQVVSNTKIDISGNLSNSDDLRTSNLKVGNILNSGEILSDEIESKDIDNLNKILAENNIKAKNIKNLDNGDIAVKVLNIENIRNTGSLEALTLKGNNIGNVGKILVKDIDIKEIDNKNLLVAIDSINSTNLKNSGELKTKELNSKDIENANNLTSKNISTTNIDNSGKILAENLETTKLVNKKDIEISNKLTSKDLANEEGKLSAKVIRTISLENKADLRVNNNLLAEKIKNSDKLLVASDLTTNDLINTAKVEAKNISIKENLINTSKINAENIEVLTAKIDNKNGEILAKNNIKIKIPKEKLILDGIYVANNKLDIEANSLVNNVNLENNGNLALNINDNLVNNNKIKSGNVLDIRVRNLVNNNELGAVSSLNIESSSFNNTGTTTFGNNKNSLNVKNEIINSGYIYSLGNLDILANDITNNGQLASVGNLNIDTNNITNQALLFSSENLDVKFKENFKNEKADIYTGGDLTVTGSGDFENRLGDITSIGNIRIEAENIRNIGEVTGSYTVDGKVGGLESNIDISKINMKKYYDESNVIIREFVRKYPSARNWTWFNNDHYGVYLDNADKLVSNYTSKMATIKSDKSIEFVVLKNIENTEGNILANNDIKIETENLINKSISVPIERNVEFRRDYELHRPGGNPGHRTYFLDGKVYAYGVWDKGYVIMKDTITTNLTADKISTISAGKNLIINAKKIGNGSYAENTRTDVEKRNENVEAIVVNKKAISERETLNTSNYIFISDNGLDEKEKINTSGKGLFKLNKIDDFSTKPGFSYLIETNLKFLDKSLYLGSEYFFKQINFSPDRNIRLLGDSFYETRLINKTILEGTGRRYLHSFKTEKEQMKYLYDNGAKAQKDLSLSLGIALTKEQIDKLNKDIIWYVEEEVKGVKVLVPKLYLTKNTLNGLKDKNVSLQAGENLSIVANEVINTGNFVAENIDVTTNNLTNLSLLGTEKASIEADNIKINAEEGIGNIGASIKAKYNLYMNANEVSNLSTKRINGHGMNILSKLENTATIEAENLNIKANNDFINTGANVNAINNLSIEAKDIKIDTLEENRYFHAGDSKNFVTIDNKKNVKSEISAGNIDIKSKNNINIKASDVVAKENLNVSASGDINVVSATDSQYYEEMKTKKRKFGGSKSSHKVDFKTQNIASNIIGNNINIESGKDISILGSNIQTGTEGEANISAKGDITQAGVKEIDYSYSKKSKSRLGALISKSTTKESMQESAIKSATVAGDKGFVYDSKNDLVLEGVNVVSTGNIKMKGNNVVINPIETESYNKVESVKKGFGGSIGLTGVTISYGKDKLSTAIKNKADNPSEITSAQNIDIEASNKVNVKALDIYAKENINISGEKGVEFSSGTNSQENKVKQSSTRFTTGVYVNSAIVGTVDNIRNMDKLVDKSGDTYGVVNTASNLVGAIRTGADAVNTIGKNGYGDSKEAGFNLFNNISTDPKDYLSIGSSLTKTKSETKTYDESAVKNSIESKNIAINSKEGSVVLEGTDITAKNLDLKAKENIEIKAADEEHKSSNKSSSSGASISATFDVTAPISVTLSTSGAKGRGNGISYVNSTINVEEKLKTESENLKVSGANIEADKVDIKAKDIVIESKQDVSKRKDTSFGGSVTVGIGPAGVTLKDLSINGSKGKGEEEWVDKQTTLIAKNGGIIKAENKLTNTGGVIASLSENEKLKVSANEIEVGNLEDKNKYENVGGGISVGFDNGKAKIPKISVLHDKIDKEQINRASAINTEFTIAGKEKTAEDLGFNTDLSKVQETTKDNEKHLNADLHTDLANREERDKLKEAGKKLSNVAEALTSSEKTLGNFPERYTQSTLAEGMADTIIGNRDRLSLLEKNGMRDGAIDDDIVNEKAGVMLSILEDTLKKFGYKGKEVRIVVTDVLDPNGNTFTSTKEHLTVFDRKFLAIATRDELLERIAHEFGHYTKEDDGTKSQKVAKYFSNLVMEKVKGVSSKEASAETYARIRNNKNVITGKEGNEIAENIPMEDREYYTTENFVSGAYSFGGRFTGNVSSYTSFNPNIGEVEKFTLLNGSIAGGLPDISLAVGKGIYLSNSQEEIEKLTKSVGGSLTIGGVSIGIDILSESKKEDGMIKDFFNARGVRFYIGVGAIPLAGEGHISFIDYSKTISKTTYKTYDEYFKKQSLPQSIRNYYNRNKVGENNGQFKNKNSKK